jgi:ferredoxin
MTPASDYGPVGSVGSQASVPQEGSSVKIVVDFDKCKSNAVCMGIAPEIFEVRDDNFLYVLQEEPPESARPLVEQAVRDCPTQAISIVD